MYLLQFLRIINIDLEDASFVIVFIIAFLCLRRSWIFYFSIWNHQEAAIVTLPICTYYWHPSIWGMMILCWGHIFSCVCCLVLPTDAWIPFSTPDTFSTISSVSKFISNSSSFFFLQTYLSCQSGCQKEEG